MSDVLIWAALAVIVLLVLVGVAAIALGIGGEQLLRSDERDETHQPRPVNDDRPAPGKNIPEEKVW